jgi:RHS repeat-associated protein
MLRRDPVLQDVETGLSYYGYRYYSPELGRWLSYDSLRELGGIMLFGWKKYIELPLYNFIGNNPMSMFDVDGLGLPDDVSAVGGLVGAVKGPAGSFYGTMGGAILSALDEMGVCATDGEDIDKDVCIRYCINKRGQMDNKFGHKKVWRKYKCHGFFKNYIDQKVLEPCNAGACAKCYDDKGVF